MVLLCVTRPGVLRGIKVYLVSKSGEGGISESGEVLRYLLKFYTLPADPAPSQKGGRPPSGVVGSHWIQHPAQRGGRPPDGKRVV